MKYGKELAIKRTLKCKGQSTNKQKKHFLGAPPHISRHLPFPFKHDLHDSGTVCIDTRADQKLWLG